MHYAGFAGGWEWVIILLAVLILFGAKRIPEFAKGLGKGVREFKKAKMILRNHLTISNLV